MQEGKLISTLKFKSKMESIPLSSQYRQVIGSRSQELRGQIETESIDEEIVRV
jgi:hypothetical protein